MRRSEVNGENCHGTRVKARADGSIFLPFDFIRSYFYGKGRSLKRPPLANFAGSGYGVISKKTLPGSGRLATG